MFKKLRGTFVQITRSVASGLIIIIPILMIGSFALILSSFPLSAYQNFIRNTFGGIFYTLFNAIYSATFGLLSLYATIAVSVVCARNLDPEIKYIWGYPLTSIAAFLIFIGFDTNSAEFAVGPLGTKGMFTALVCSVGGAYLYRLFSVRIFRAKKTFADGADNRYNDMLAVIAPAIGVISASALANTAISAIFGKSSFHSAFTGLLYSLFTKIGGGFFGGLAFVLLSSVLWFCGVHGSDVLDGVSDLVLVPPLQNNIAAAAAGAAPAEILTKPTIDIFVLIGGCGSAMCLLIAMLLFSRRRSGRSLSKMAFLPMLFNINELMIFGLPVIFNLSLVIPFILVPVMNYIITYAAMYFGFVPLVTAESAWTTPIFLGGFAATGSIRGSILQLVCLAAGTAVYIPFVRHFDREKTNAVLRDYDGLADYFSAAENDGRDVVLTSLEDSRGTVAKTLVYDLRHAIKKSQPALYYQPQYNSDGICFGAEALLRWKHELFGMVYPPLVIKIASEAGMLLQLDEYIIARALRDSEKFNEEFRRPFNICVNITGSTFSEPQFLAFLESVCGCPSVKKGLVCLEVTEQTAMRADDGGTEIFKKIRALGFKMAIDDFSMGHTSLKYLQSNAFDLVKLDGALVRDITKNPRSLEIVASIVKLSHSLGFTVLAEYVENTEIRDALLAIGCKEYQGYLYSPAIAPDKLSASVSKIFAEQNVR
ncbi:MAG: EAL domain-containing protein [Eubacteriales bacterium]